MKIAACNKWVQLFTLLCLLWSSCSALAETPCEELDQQLALQKQKLPRLQQQLDHLNQLRNGQLNATFSLEQLIPVDLQNLSEVNSGIQQLKLDSAEAVPLIGSWRGCPNTKQFEQQATEIRALKETIEHEQLHLLQKPRMVQLALARGASQWQRLYQLQQQIDSWVAAHPENLAALSLKGEIDRWLSQWRSSVQLWLSQVLTTNSSTTLDDTWLKAVKIPPPDSTIEWQRTELMSVEEYPELQASWRQELNSASNALVRLTERWQNNRIWQQG